MKIKQVNKPWGNEQWIADGIRTPYALKRILFKAGNRTSLQVHRFKFETNYVLSGEGILIRSKYLYDFDRNKFLNTENDDIFDSDNYDFIDLFSGFVFDVSPGFIHRVVASTDLEFIEASTPEVDDVIRLHDDQGRSDGRIDSEHGN